ncbi:RHS repeat-associated core domain-containing protein [Actinoplanes oblitus]|uniref:RHS repeat-associated core domain-containing protein n=1 Tax=Actinoplanes oblitus TaxID=3040509 RepID=A0ABY8WS35_9ACTN|nr:RHS repeat-associated core domain-containing protein [Actinoplanes oblitus]WIN00700.1 RHS repeat-associated core domain-containing protein [Actinoplanes oblitus]
MVAAAAVTASMMSVPALAAERPAPLKAQAEKLDHDGGEVAGRGWAEHPGKQVDLPAPVWPAAGSAVRVTPKAGLARSAAVASGMTAAVVDRGAVPARWRRGVVVKVSAQAAGTARVAMNYDKFRYAYGGNWSSRLRWWRLPDCALSTPDRAGCSPTLLPSGNDVSSTTVTGEVPVAAARTAMVALAAAPSGDSGDFGATPLSSSSTWSAGGATGDFTWSYPMRAPNGNNGPQPGLSLSYSSSSVDGRSSATNNQPSWIGEGFEFSPGSVERRYVSCDDDKSGSPNNPAHSFEQCWRSNNATLSLGGSSTELIYEAGKGWHGRSENGSKVELLTGADNGDDNGEYWKVTTNDGIQYFFGLNKLAGQSDATNSAWTAPVYGNHEGEPCHKSAFADSDCKQAWRWNLDYAIDTHGNTISYWYGTESNKYAQEGSASKTVSYIRGGYLSRIDYGTWDRGAGDRSVAALAQVNFEVGDRCLADCSTHDGGHWPDTPWDQECKADAATCDEYSPTFWTTKRLTKISTRVYDTSKAGGAGWQDVDSWTLEHSFPSPGDGQKGGLWLKSVTHTGLVGGTAAMPAVTFDPVAKPNRVLTKTNTTNNWLRMAAVHTETGAILQVSYSQPECSAGNLPSSPQNNTKLCYPVIGPDPYSTSGADITEWWHKYVVTQITEMDVQLADGHQAPAKNTYYTYEGDPAWHYADDDGLSKPKYKTWDQFRGYKTVSTRVGDTNQTLTRTTYFRGMHGDKLAPSGGTRSVTVPASLGSETVYDEDQFAGMVREQVVYNGTEDKPVSKTVNVPWLSAPTASRTINGDTATARYVNTAKVYTGTALGVNGSRGWRVNSTSTTFDSYGMPVAVQDNGDDARSGDEKCTTTTYNRNTASNLLSLPSRVTTTALACGVKPTSQDQMVDDAVTFYDGATSASTAPVLGDLTRTDLMKDWTPAGGTVWLTSGQATFDKFGRQATETDARGLTVTSTYTPAAGLLTQKTETSGMGWVTTTKLNPAWSSVVQISDVNKRITDVAYDPLGRTTKTWDAGWTKADHPSQPVAAYTYHFDANRSSYPWVKSTTLNAAGGTNDSYTIYDGFLRSRQTQRIAVGGGRVVADTLYDQYGQAYLAFGAHAEPGSPSGTLWWEPEWSVPTQTLTEYDRAGRATASVFRSGDGVTNIVDKWRTTTSYEGDRVTVVPPAGSTPKTTVSDVQGRTVELWQYNTAAGVAGGHDTVKYGYDAKNRMTSAADAAGDTWTYKYDLLGRQIETVDPDKGKTTSTYNDLGDLLTTTDARNQVLAYSYDSLGRQTGVYDGSVADANKRVELKYDKLANGLTLKGQVTEKTRYETAADGTRQPYTWRATNFTQRNQVSGEQWIIPAAETGLGGTYVYSHSYSPYTGAPTSLTYPAASTLPSEGVETAYDKTTGLPTTLTSLWSTVGTYVAGQDYSAYGEPTSTMLKITGGVYAQQTLAYELDTRRVHQVRVKPETATGTVADRTYSYDASGNIQQVTDAPQVGQTDIQCFVYDSLIRLTSAWTPKAGVDCKTTAPSLDNLGGPAPYWIDWTLDALGNRTKEVSHSAAGDTTRGYTVPTAGKDVIRPHAVTGMTTTSPDQSSVTVGYGYDAAGNMTSRPGDTGTQTITWDAEGHAVKTVEGTKVATNLFDADGTRLIRRDSTGTTLFLPGQEIRRNGASTTANDATRYYSFGGTVVASRTVAAQSLTWLFSDHQGTQSTAVNAYTQQVSIRRQTPYGAPRGTNPAWVNGKGFVGGDIDATGLTHLGAREYDPSLGRFISVDPVQDLTDPQQWNAYSYCGNNPITQADPTGMRGDDLFYGTAGAAKRESNDYTKDPTSGGAGDGNDGGGNNGGDNNGGGSSSGDGGGGNGGSGSHNQPKPKKKAWWQRGIDWVAENKNTLAGAAVGITTFVGCEALTAGTGTVGCMMAAGAAGKMTTDALDGNIHGVGDAINSFNTGAVEGLLAVPLAAADLVSQAGNIAGDIKEGDWAGATGHSALAALDVLTVVDGVKGPGKCMHSFTAVTPVLLANGDSKPIGDIEVGDEVLATDPQTGQNAAEQVEVLHDNVDEDFADLTVQLTDGTSSVINTTAHHPFWDETDQKWTNAADLPTGHHLRDQAGHDAATVTNVYAYPGAHHMHNLTVANLHTYYVLAGDTPVLVHNCGDTPAPAMADKPLGPKTARETTESLAGQLGDALGVPVKPAKGDGFTMSIPNKPRNLVLRVMHAGSGGREFPYWRLSVEGKESFTRTGERSNDPKQIHVDIDGDSFQTIMGIVNGVRR